ncbi:thiol reductant ABC exporter subunit CydD [Leifsonia sp. YAF41]|uniref:thiol reductant ABC exporter subunit CydD n=1 Tax=Leifsonia sp. YAF41 TaxID=3233086 RepID=UPI003F9AAC75
MRPLDPRLLRYATAARWFLAGTAVVSLVQTFAVIAFAWLLSQAITGAVEGRPLSELAGGIGALAAVVVLRAVLIWLQELLAQRASAVVKTQLRSQVLDAVARRGPDWLAGRQSAQVSTVVTTGLDALDNYFSRYLPQLLLTAIATPILVLVMLTQDVPSGITVIIALPLIPIFMILIGLATRGVQKSQWESLQHLSNGFLDLVGGLGTLKIFGRENRQTTRLRAITEDYRQRTMAVLKVSFLSGFVLELAASLSVALVAVGVGLRLVDGSLLLGVGLFVLLLAPEAFLPVRQVGAQFHAAADGLAAAEEVFAILDEDEGRGVERAARTDAALAALPFGRSTDATLCFDDVTIMRGDSPVIDRFTAEFRAGEFSVITGPSGVGKSTLVAALQGFIDYDGMITLDDALLQPGSSRGWLAWSGQRPGLFAGTIAENVTLGEASVDVGLLRRALADAGAAELDPETMLAVAGDGLSGGQAQRVSVARAFYRARAEDCAVVVLDEPSSALDAAAEAALIHGVKALAAEGRIVIVISHRPAVCAAADAIVRVQESAHV